MVSLRYCPAKNRPCDYGYRRCPEPCGDGPRPPVDIAALAEQWAHTGKVELGLAPDVVIALGNRIASELSLAHSRLAAVEAVATELEGEAGVIWNYYKSDAAARIRRALGAPNLSAGDPGGEDE